MFDCDVLIVGAGPVGTSLALELALHKVSFRVIDKFPVRSDKSRALVVHSRILELLNRHGDAHELASRGNGIKGIMVSINQKPISWLDNVGSSPAEAEFPLPVDISQAETERFLDGCLAKHNISVERPVTAISVVQDETGVTTELEGPNGERETIRTRYVVGCDGAHSVVRHSANLKFDGATYPQDFALCDAYLRDSKISHERLAMYLGDGFLIVLPLGPGRFRIVVAGSTLSTINDDHDKTEVPLDHFQKALERLAGPGCGKLYDPIWLTRFRLHRRGVNNYRDGRLFVAGDAAHIHSPVGGQGMNTGIQDAFNLGWKLASVLHGRTSNPEALLDSYNAERYPIGQQLLNGTDRLFTIIASTNFFFVRLRNFILPWILPWVWNNVDRTRKIYHLASQLGVGYRGSPIVGTAHGFTGPVAGGNRMPDGEIKKISGIPKSGEETMTRMHDICVGASHHLIFFIGSDDEASAVATRATIVKAIMKINNLVKEGDLKFHVIGTTGLTGFDGGSLEDSAYQDIDGSVHERYGFSKTPGYALSRPDSFLAHIGPLSSLDELLAFLEGYF